MCAGPRYAQPLLAALYLKGSPSIALRFVKITIYFLLSIFFGFSFYERYWKYSDCIEAVKSSCVTEDGSNLTSSGMIWVVPCFIFLVLGIYQSYKIVRKC